MDSINSRTLPPQEGFDLEAHLFYDEHGVSPRDMDDDPDDEYLRAWDNDMWHYTGVVVEASRAGVVLGSDSVWGMEYGSFRNSAGELVDMDPLADGGGFGTLNPETGQVEYEQNVFANGYSPDLIAEAIAAAKRTLAAINETEPCETPAQT